MNNQILDDILKTAPGRGEQKFLSVSAIREGTVIDHIAPGQAMRLLSLLNLTKGQARITVGLNLPSTKIRLKDLIKVENRELTQVETDQIAIFSPHTSVNIISEYRVIKKFPVALPKVIAGVIVCPNPKCITNYEASHRLFQVHKRSKQVLLLCHYCEKTFFREEIKEYTI